MNNLELKFKIKTEGHKELSQSLKKSKTQLIALEKETVNVGNKSKTAYKKASDGLKKAQKESSKFSDSTKQLTGQFNKLAAAGVAGIAVVAAIKLNKMAIEAVNAGDAIQKLSIRLGISTEALSQYRHVATLSGVSFETLSMGMQRMTRRVSEAAQGTGEAVKALAELNISAVELNKLAPEDQFEIIADKMAELGSKSDKVRLSMKLFDTEGVALVQTMEKGAAGIREMRDEADRLGLTLSKETADKMAKAKDEIARMEAAFDGKRLLKHVLALLGRFVVLNIPRQQSLNIFH